jgi:hypothetical protein
LRNDGLERALEETWKNKEKFYEDNKGLSILEIIKKTEGVKRKNTLMCRNLLATWLHCSRK